MKGNDFPRYTLWHATMVLPARLVGSSRPLWRLAFVPTTLSKSVQRRPVGLRANSSAARSLGQSQGNSPLTSEPSNQTKFDPAEPRLAIAFTCTADGCNHRSAHTFTKRAYERGIILIQCPSCKNRHLIADNLGWFKDDTENGRLKNVEDILRTRGEQVQRGTLDADGVVEISGN
ncbi:zf-DNL-domain-containing protein [Chiua virens]|nr:zf-DNL-domain-containing protein [Chiua virens]